MRFYLPAYPFLRSLLPQITTGTTKTDTARPGTTNEGTATVVVIETGTGIATKGATGTEDMTGIAIDGRTRDGLEDTKGVVDTDENVRIDLVQGATTTCKLTPLQRVTAATVATVATAAAIVIEDGARNAERTVWVLRNEGALPQPMRPRWA